MKIKTVLLFLTAITYSLSLSANLIRSSISAKLEKFTSADSRPHAAIVEYLEGDGKSFSSIPYSPTMEDVIIVKYSLLSSLQNDGCVFGVSHPNSARIGFGVWHSRNSNRLSRQQIYSFVGGSSGGEFGSWLSGEANQTKPIYCIIDYPNKHYIDCNNQTFSLPSSVDVVPSSFIGLFCICSVSGNSAWCGPSKLRIYSFQVVRNDEVIIDLMPIRIGEEGFFFDAKSGEIYENIGTGTFSVGPDMEVLEI